MKIKFITFLILVILFVPLVSNSAVVPSANLTVIVNTQGSDAVFLFNLQNYPLFDLQTQNLSASTSLSITAFSGYSLSQDVVLGLKINSIFCTSSNPNDVFWYQSNSVSFSPIMNESITCIFNNIKAIVPVLIVPGLLGSAQQDGQWFIDPILHT